MTSSELNKDFQMVMDSYKFFDQEMKNICDVFEKIRRSVGSFEHFWK